MVANEYRRRLLGALLDTPRMDEAAVIDCLVEAGCDPKAAVVSTYQIHLPMLEGEGLVEWDRDAGVVSRGAAFDSVRPIVEWIADNECRLVAGAVEAESERASGGGTT